MTTASLPYIPADIRQALIATAGDALTHDWSSEEPVYWPKLLGEDQALAAELGAVVTPTGLEPVFSP